MHRPCHILGRANLVSPFTNGLRNVYNVALLKGVCAKHLGTYLPRNDNHGRAVHHGIGNTRNGVSCSRSTGNQTHTRFATYTGITLGCMGSSLFVAHKDVVELLAIIVERIIHRHNGSPWVAKECSYTLVDQGTHQNLCATYYVVIRIVHHKGMLSFWGNIERGE